MHGSSDWRSLFPITKKWAYFNHASVSPPSARSAKIMRAWAADVADNACIREGPWKERIEASRAGLASLINASPAEIAFVANTTEGVARVVNGFDWREGDVAVVPNDEYVSNLLPWAGLERRGVTVHRIPMEGRNLDVDVLQQVLCPRTRIVALSAVHFVTGWRADLVRIGSLCRERGIDLCVDAVQAVGIVPIDVQVMQISYLVSGGHKFLTGPPGSGFLYVATNRLNSLAPSAPGWKSVDGDLAKSDPPFFDDARRFESGTASVGAQLGLAEGVGIIQEIGVPEIAARVRHSISYLAERLRMIGAEIVSPVDGERALGILAFRFPDHPPQDLRDGCLADGVVIGVRRGLLRASVHFYNSTEDADRLVAALTRGISRREFGPRASRSMRREPT